MNDDQENTHIDKIYENGTYVYTITDAVGNTFTTTVKIESFDRNAPDLYIEDEDNQVIQIGEDYIHQYKPVGCDGPCWVSISILNNSRGFKSWTSSCICLGEKQ